MDCDTLQCYADVFTDVMYTACMLEGWRHPEIVLCTYSEDGEFILRMGDKTYIVLIRYKELEKALDEEHYTELIIVR